jgi:hypothetical protein
MPQGQLTLTIDTNFSQSEIYFHNGGWEYGDSGVVVPDSVYTAEAEHTYNVSQTLANDLIQHGVKLKDLFWHFTWPRMREGQGVAEMGLGSTEQGNQRNMDPENVLEKMVMGSLYEAEEKGKFERRKEWNGYRDHQPPY